MRKSVVKPVFFVSEGFLGAVQGPLGRKARTALVTLNLQANLLSIVSLVRKAVLYILYCVR